MTVVEVENLRVNDPVVPAQLLERDVDHLPLTVAVLWLLLRWPHQEVDGRWEPGNGGGRSPWGAVWAVRSGVQVEEWHFVGFVFVAFAGGAAHLESEGTLGQGGEEVVLDAVGGPAVVLAGNSATWRSCWSEVRRKRGVMFLLATSPA